MSTPIQKELEEIRNRLNELGRAIHDEEDGWDFEAIQKTWPEAMVLITRRRHLWESQEAKDLGLKGGVDHELF